MKTVSIKTTAEGEGYDDLHVLQLILFLSEFALHLLQLFGVLVNRFRLFIDLLLQCPRDLHHVLVMSLQGNVQDCGGRSE